MNRYFLLAIFVLTVPAVAQDLGIFEEVSAGNFYGLGARQMAMGGTGIASPMDGAALFYNPAALARIPRIEFQLGLTHQNFSNTTSMSARRNRLTAFSSVINQGSADQTNTRLASLNLAVPVPTYRGSLVVAFGINRVISFDRTAFYHVRDVRESDDAMVDIRAREHQLPLGGG